MTDDLNSRAGLLPCPFCGADAKLRGGPLAQETYSIWCRGTPSHHQDYGLDAEKAIAAWNTRALPAAQVQAEPVAQEPVAWRVYSMMLQGAPNNVKARGIGSDPTEYLYPAHREADARECARLMRGEVQPLYSHPATTPPAPDAELDALVGRLEKLADDMGRHATPEWDESEDVRKAITALRARKGGAE